MQNNNTGFEEAANSSHETQQSLLPDLHDNAAFRQSVYIGAIARTLGFVGLVPQVEDTRNGVHYNFDFEEPDERILIKVFTTIDPVELERYLGHPADPIVIIDASRLRVELDECKCCGVDVLYLAEDPQNVAHRDESNYYVCYDRDLWTATLHRNEISNVGGWQRMIPAIVEDVLEQISHADDEDE